jgi:hypothetical protein
MRVGVDYLISIPHRVFLSADQILSADYSPRESSAVIVSTILSVQCFFGHGIHRQQIIEFQERAASDGSSTSLLAYESCASSKSLTPFSGICT